MSVKRSRVCRSSSLDSFINPRVVRERRQTEEAAAMVDTPNRKSVEKSLCISKQTSVGKTDQHLPILSIGSPERKTSHDELQIERKKHGFCETCYICKKKIGDEDAVYMYGYLQAFCSLTCRTKQMMLDNEKAPDDYDERKLWDDAAKRWIANFNKNKFR